MSSRCSEWSLYLCDNGVSGGRSRSSMCGVHVGSLLVSSLDSGVGPCVRLISLVSIVVSSCAPFE